jgi:hypothetical protein
MQSLQHARDERPRPSVAGLARRLERGPSSAADGGLGPSLFAGLLAAAMGTAAMDALLFVRYRRGGGTQGPLEWESSSGVHTWEDVSAPGLVGKRTLELVLGHDVPDRWARPTENVVHWATGVGWGIPFGAAAGKSTRRPWLLGLDLGPTAWLASYIILPVLKVYKPIWDYDAKTLAKDLSAHLVYGVTVGGAFAALAAQGPARSFRRQSALR